ncbi:MAG TPA: ECF-type sigma factor [Bryobacteraceae bacterium]|jgi:RNA polymerase sigma factor (TIGR02999 family)
MTREITALLRAWAAGNTAALNDALPAIYAELCSIAAARLRARRKGCTLDPSALVHEAYLRLAESSPAIFESRSHFLAVASLLMREILVDRFRAKKALKRGSNGVAVTLGEVPGGSGPEVDLLDLDAVLDELAAAYQRHAKIVEMRFFGGLSVEETAGALGISRATVKRDWMFARAWITERLGRR